MSEGQRENKFLKAMDLADGNEAIAKRFIEIISSEDDDDKDDKQFHINNSEIDYKLLLKTAQDDTIETYIDRYNKTYKTYEKFQSPSIKQYFERLINRYNTNLEIEDIEKKKKRIGDTIRKFEKEVKNLQNYENLEEHCELVQQWKNEILQIDPIVAKKLKFTDQYKCFSKNCYFPRYGANMKLEKQFERYKKAKNEIEKIMIEETKKQKRMLKINNESESSAKRLKK